VVPEINVPLEAVIVDVPTASAEAMPFVAIIVAVAVVPELQETAAVGLTRVPSLSLNFAVKVSTPPTAIVGFV
jgi:hypothetical protein